MSCGRMSGIARAGQGLSPIHAPLTDAIGKLAEVAARQIALLEEAKPGAIHAPLMRRNFEALSSS
jgi:hypothetical protein